MHRVTTVLMAASLLSLVAMGLILPASMAMADRAPAGLTSQSTVTVYMSSSEGGPRQRTFPADTTRIYAVVAYENAVQESYVVRLTDLSGIRVLSQPIGPLSGDGTASIAVSAERFLQTYRSAYVETRDQAAADNEAIVDACQNRPAVPEPWPPPEPTPGPTPPPDPYVVWAEFVMGKAEQIRSTTGEMTRTLQAMTTLPNIADDLPAVATDLDGARGLLATAHGRLAATSRLLLPVTGRPDPATACQGIQAAGQEIASAIATVDGALARLPADLSAWRFPATRARYDGSRFAGCSEYKTDLVAGVDPGGTPALSALWTIGDPGAPALIFPAADQTDRGLVGYLSLRLPEGARHLYARQVKVPGAPHEGDLGAFVTDANCLPVTQNVVLWASPELSGGATVDPSTVVAQEGEASAKLLAGDDVTHMRQGGWVIACAGADCVPLAPTPRPGAVPPGQAWGSVRFEVVGTAAVTNTLLKIDPDEINRASDETAGIALQVNDRNGRPVANGTRAQIWIDVGSPGLLAYDRRRVVGGRPVGDAERVVLGKSADVVVDGGLTRYPASSDPGFVNTGRLFLFAGDQRDGEVTLCYRVDAVEACQPKAVTIVNRIQLYLPSVMREHAQYNATATATRRFPTVQVLDLRRP